MVASGCSDDGGAANPDVSTLDSAGVEMSIAPEAGRDIPAPPDIKPPDQAASDKSILDLTADTAIDLASDTAVDKPLTADTAPSADTTVDTLSPDGWFTSAKCVGSQKVVLTSGTATVNGDTTGCTNEFGSSSINCGTSAYMDGPQRYYTVSMKKGNQYALTLTPGFKAHMYVFMESDCGDAMDIDLSCGSSGFQGGVIGPVAKGSSKTLSLTPITSGNFVIAVDSDASSLFGTFSLKITDFSPATNITCAKAKPVALTGSTTTISGNTGVIKDEFPSLTCKGHKLVGPQLYYKLSLKKGHSYLFTHSPDYWSCLYLVPTTACSSASAIGAACSSGGATGGFISSVAQGKSGTLLFKAPSTADYVMAVDGVSAVVGGKFTTTVDHFPPAVNDTCAKAQAITLSSGKATVSGNTIGANNQYGTSIYCGGIPNLKGPQLYYKVALGKGQSIKLSLAPAFTASLYLFGEAACTSATQVNSACASVGISGDIHPSIAAGTTGMLVFTAPAAGNYVIAVDSSAQSVGGKFTLSLETFTPAKNGTCAAAQPVTLTAGAASLTGDTSGIKDEYSTLTCSPVSGALDGPQAYYQVSLAAGALYRFELSPSFKARMVLFPKSACGSVSSIKAACGSGGVTGDTSYACSSGGVDALYFKPGTAGTYILAVDSTDRHQAGTFALKISTVPATTNGTCAKAQVLALSGGKATVTSDTCNASNEYNSLTCGLFGPSSITLNGPQLYYRLTLAASKNYKLSVTMTTRGGVLYVVPQTACGSVSAIQAACSSKGGSGNAVIAPYGATTTISFTPSISGDYIIAMDGPKSPVPGSITCGRFTLTVTQGP